MRIKFKLSSKYFQGYEFVIHKDEIDSLEQVSENLKNNLIIDLKNLHLEYLLSLVNKKPFHYHGYDLINVLTSEDVNKTWYICESCCQDN